MINIKYKKIYKEFIKKYEEIHVNPWHEISKEESNRIYEDLVNKNNIVDEYSFKYLMDYVIKRLSGKTDSHTRYLDGDVIPYNFRLFGDEVLVDYPEDMKGYCLISINGINIKQIIDELDDVIAYGTTGRRIFETEISLRNRVKMFSLPSFRNVNEIIYQFKDKENNIIYKKITKTETYNDTYDNDKYLSDRVGKYRVINNTLIYNHSSIQLKYKDVIESSIKNLEMEDLSSIESIIVDIRGNTGGYSKLNEPLINFLKKNNDKTIVCLTDYRIFSGGRFALRDLLKLGAITIGEPIATPFSCYGNNYYFTIDGYDFIVSSCYLDPIKHIQANTKEGYNNMVSNDLIRLNSFNPDIEVWETKEDYINNIDTILEYALNYIRTKRMTK